MRSLPARGVWIEIMRTIDTTLETHRRSPQGECGLKLHGRQDACLLGRSLPARGVWIEISSTTCVDTCTGRSPQGECGLKFLDRLVKRSVTGSLSSRRAWIETTLTIGLYFMLCRPRLSFCVKLPSGRCVVISDAEFDRWGEAAERGDYGGSRGPVMHGPIFQWTPIIPILSRWVFPRTCWRWLTRKLGGWVLGVMT